MIPSKHLDFLKTMLGRNIISVRRQIFVYDMDFDDWEQSADGSVEIKFDDGTIAHFIADTSHMSVGIVEGPMPFFGESYTCYDVSTNSFWRERIGQAISDIALLRSLERDENYPCEFGVELRFCNGKKALIEFLDDEDHPDMIRVASHYDGPPCSTQNLK